MVVRFDIKTVCTFPPPFIFVFAYLCLCDMYGHMSDGLRLGRPLYREGS